MNINLYYSSLTLDLFYAPCRYGKSKNEAISRGRKTNAFPNYHLFWIKFSLTLKLLWNIVQPSIVLNIYSPKKLPIIIFSSGDS